MSLLAGLPWYEQALICGAAGAALGGIYDISQSARRIAKTQEQIADMLRDIRFNTKR